MRFKDLSEAEKIKSIEAGCPIVLQCEISDPTAQVWWYKDGIELHPQVGIDIQSDGNIRKLTVQSAEISHTGLYICAVVEDDITFKVIVQGDSKFKVTNFTIAIYLIVFFFFLPQE